MGTKSNFQFDQLMEAYERVNQVLVDVKAAADNLPANVFADTADAVTRYVESVKSVAVGVDQLTTAAQVGSTNAVINQTLTTNVSKNYAAALGARSAVVNVAGADELLAAMDQLFTSPVLAEITNQYAGVNEVVRQVMASARTAAEVKPTAIQTLGGQPKLTVADAYGSAGASAVLDNVKSVAKTVTKLTTAIREASTASGNGTNAIAAQDALNLIAQLKVVQPTDDLDKFMVSVNALTKTVTSAAEMLNDSKPGYSNIGQYRVMLNNAALSTTRLQQTVATTAVELSKNGIDQSVFTTMLSAIDGAGESLLRRIGDLDDRFAQTFRQRVMSANVDTGLLRANLGSFQPYVMHDDVDSNSVFNPVNSRRVGFATNSLVGRLGPVNDLVDGKATSSMFADAVQVSATSFLNDVRRVDLKSLRGSQREATAADVGNGLRVHVNNLTAAINAEAVVNPKGITVKMLRATRAEAVTALEEVNAVDESGVIEKILASTKSSLGLVMGVISGGLVTMGIAGAFSARELVRGTFNQYEANGNALYDAARQDLASTGEFDRGRAVARLHLGRDLFAATSGNVKVAEVNQMYASILSNVGGHYGASQSSASADADSMTRNLFAISRASGLTQDTLNSALKVLYKDSGLGATEAAVAVANVVDQARAANVPVDTYVKTVSTVGARLRDIGVYGPGAIDLIGNLADDGVRLEDASSLVEHTAGAQAQLASSWGSSVLYGYVLGDRSRGPWRTILANNLSHNANGDVNRGRYASLGRQLRTKYDFTLTTAGGGAAGYAHVVKGMIADGYTQRDASQLATLMINGKDDEVTKILEGIDDKREHGDEYLQKAIAKANLALTKAGDQSAETTKMLADAKTATVDLALLIDDKLGPLLKTFSEATNTAIDEFANLMGKLVDAAGELASKPIVMNAMGFAAANPLTTAALGVTTVGLLGATASKVTTAARSVLTDGSARLWRSASKNLPRGRYALIPAALGLGTLAASSKAEAAELEQPSLSLNTTLVDGTAKVNVVNRDELVRASSDAGGAQTAGLVLSAGTLQALTKLKGNLLLLGVSAATAVGSELMTDDDRPVSSKLTTGALVGGGSALGAVGAGALASRFGLGRLGTFAAMAGGGLGGSQASRAVAKALGLANANDDVLDERSAILKGTAEQYSTSVIEVLDSDSEQGKIMRTSLERNGVDYSTLTGLQKVMLGEMFAKLATAHKSLDTTLAATAAQLKRNQAFKVAQPKMINGKPIVVSGDVDAQALEDGYKHVQHGNGVYDENYYRGEYAQSRYDELKDLYDAEDDPKKRAKLNEDMTFYASIVSYVKHLNGDDADLDEEAEKQSTATTFASIRYHQSKADVREAVLQRWRARYDDDTFVNAAGYAYYGKALAASAVSQAPASTEYTPAKVGSGHGALGRVPYVEWSDAINKAAAKYGVDPKLMAAMIESESNWNPNAKSPVGATGLAQFMPETAQGLGIDPNDPLQAIEGMAMYTRSIQDQLGTTDPRLVAAAYNAGPEAVRQAGGVPNYTETQNYVNSVLQRYGDEATVAQTHWTGGGLKPPHATTLAEQSKLQLAAYDALASANGAKTVKGRIVNGMYVDANQSPETVDSIIANALPSDYPGPAKLGGVVHRQLAKTGISNDAKVAADKARAEEDRLRAQQRATVDSTTVEHSVQTVNNQQEPTDDNTAILSVAGKLKPGKTMNELRSAILKVATENSAKIDVVKA